MVVVLGIDPGSAHTGYGVVLSRGRTLAALDGGVIETRSGTPLERRLAEIHARVCDLIAEHRPEALAVEELYFGRNVRTAFAVGQARGVVLLSAGLAGVPCFSYTPQAVKQAVCGSGAAEKGQVQRMVGLAPVASRAARARPRRRCPRGGHLPRERRPARGGARVIASVSGTVIGRRPGELIVEAAGVGYRLAVSAETLRRPPAWASRRCSTRTSCFATTACTCSASRPRPSASCS